MKPVIIIDPNNVGNCLPAIKALSSLKDKASYHEIRDLRHPLGVYNLSLSRICDKVKKCADKLEKYWVGTSKDQAIKDEIIDYLELSLYAAAEHNDDIETVAKTFFKNDFSASKDKSLRSLKKNLKPLRDEISNYTNTIKHNHGRIRLFETDFHHDGAAICLLGFFVEGYKNGQAAPHHILHSNGKKIISITSILWEILTYISLSSIELSNFLESMDAVNQNNDIIPCVKIFRDTAIKLTRLPLYTFDEDHPFNKTKWVIEMNEEMVNDSNSGIYGSIQNKWSKSEDHKFDGWRLGYAGDGVTKSFHIALPERMNITYWE